MTTTRTTGRVASVSTGRFTATSERGRLVAQDDSLSAVLNAADVWMATRGEDVSVYVHIDDAHSLPLYDTAGQWMTSEDLARYLAAEACAD